MPRTSPSQPTPSLHEIYTKWTEALTLPPTPRLSALRRLTGTITSKSTSNIALHPIPLSRLFLDLSLTYAYLGEYHLASLGFERVVNAGTQHAFAFFALGLSRAELGDWKAAKLDWMRCLRCFETSEGQLKSIPYQPFQQAQPSNSDDDATTRNIGLGEQWLLERKRVEFNHHRAVLETKSGCKKLGIRRLRPEDTRQGLNGIPAGLRFGPDGWFNAELERAEAKVFRPLEDIGKPISSRSSPQSSDASPVIKSLPPLPPQSNTPAAPVVSKLWYVDSPTLGEDFAPEQSFSPTGFASPSVYDSASSVGQKSIKSRGPTSPNIAIPTPLSLYFSDGLEHDTKDSESIRGFSGIDEAMALWDLPLDHPIFTNPDFHHVTQPEESENEEYDSEACSNKEYDDTDDNKSQGDTTLITDFIPGDIGNQEYIENAGLDKTQIPQSGEDEELLQPRVFEGFGPRM